LTRNAPTPSEENGEYCAVVIRDVANPVAGAGIADSSTAIPFEPCDGAAGATVVGATVVGVGFVGTAVVGATGATVVGATVVGATVVGATVVGATVVGATVVGATVVGATGATGATVVGATGATVVGVDEPLHHASVPPLTRRTRTPFVQRIDPLCSLDAIAVVPDAIAVAVATRTYPSA